MFVYTLFLDYFTQNLINIVSFTHNLKRFLHSRLEYLLMLFVFKLTPLLYS